MAYTPTTWTDRQVTNPLRFTLNNVSTNVYDLVPTEGTVIQAGTPLNASNLNNIENGLVGHETRITDAESDITGLTTSKADLTGATFTGTVTAPTLNGSTVVQEGGIALSSKYVRLDGTSVMTGTLTIQNASAGATNLQVKNSGNDAYTRFVADSSYNYIQSGNLAFTASKGLALTGYLGNNMTDFKVLANTLTLSGVSTAITGSLTVNNGTNTLVASLKNSTNGTMDFVTNPTYNGIQSMLSASTSPRDFKIEGSSGGTLNNITLVATTVTATGALNASTLTTTGNASVGGTLTAGVLSVTGATTLNGSVALKGDVTIYDSLGNSAPFITRKDGNSSGIGVAITGGATTIIGGGESAITTLNDAGTVVTDENMYVTSDQAVRIFSNIQAGYASKHELQLGSSGRVFLNSDIIAHPSRGTRIDNLGATPKIMLGAQTVTCSVAIDQCPNGWLLEWKDESGTAFFTYEPIWKHQVTGSSTMYRCGSSAVASNFQKVLSHTTTVITGSDSNDDAGAGGALGTGNARVLSAVYMF